MLSRPYLSALCAALAVLLVAEAAQPPHAGWYPPSCQRRSRFRQQHCSVTCGQGVLVTDEYCYYGGRWFHKLSSEPCNEPECPEDSSSPTCITFPHGPCQQTGVGCMQYIMRQCNGGDDSIAVRACDC